MRRARPLPVLTSLPLALVALGCGLDPLDSLAPCDDARRLTSGECCPVWTRAEDGRTCAARTFTLPTEASGVGNPGSNTIELAVDARGRGIAAWASADGLLLQTSVAEEQGSGAWTARRPDAALPGGAEMLDVAAEPDGSALVVWRQYNNLGGGIFQSRRDPSGVWSDPPDLDSRLSFPDTAYEPRIAVHPSGEILLVWNQWRGDGYGVALARRAPGSLQWELPASATDALSPPVFFSNSPQIAVGARGDALITWYQSSGMELMVRASERLGSSGEFSRPSADDIISPPGAPVDSHPISNPSPAVGPSGEAVIVWTQENGKGAIPVYIATRDGDGAWTKPKDLDDSFSRPYGTASCARPAFDAKGELYVTWYQDEGSGHRAYAARRAASGEWIDSGRSPILLSTTGWQGYTPVLAIGADTAVLAVWAESLNGAWRVSARRTGKDLGWGPVEVLSPEAPGVITGLDAAAGGPTSRMVVGWTFGAFAKERAYFATID